MPLLTRIASRDAAAAFLRRRRAQALADSDAPRTDANGFYPHAMPPDVFARQVMRDVASRGDDFLCDICEAMDGARLQRLDVPTATVRAAIDQLDQAQLAAIETAIDRVDHFHRQNLPRAWFDDTRGVGEIVRPVARVGCYIPGGTAPLASTVIMTAVPARAAGVPDVFVTTPPFADGMPHPAVLAACHLAEVTDIFVVGGVPGIAAFAIGTETIPQVDMICGPGNVWVTAAKKAAYGIVGVEGIYGPTETMVVADDTAAPDLVAADLIAQAEHDTMAAPILVTFDAGVAADVERHLRQQLADLSRATIATAAFENNGTAFIVEDLDDAASIINDFAPEHLCVVMADPDRLIDRLHGFGGLFTGEWSAEVLGDYIAGPSHVMPTGGSARWSAALSARDFVRVIPHVGLTREQFLQLADATSALARLETLEGHARASDLRRQRADAE